MEQLWQKKTSLDQKQAYSLLCESSQILMRVKAMKRNVTTNISKAV